MGNNKDNLNGWRESIRKYAGDSEYDATADAIKAYEEEQKRLAKIQDKEKQNTKKTEEELTK